MRSYLAIVVVSLPLLLFSQPVCAAPSSNATEPAKVHQKVRYDTGHGAMAGKRTHTPLTITKHVDSATPAVVAKGKVKSHSNTNNN